MSFKLLNDNQVLALAIDEWLMRLDDDDWEEALLHIEMRKRQRAKKKSKWTDSQEYRAQPAGVQKNPQNVREPI